MLACHASNAVLPSDYLEGRLRLSKDHTEDQK